MLAEILLTRFELFCGACVVGASLICWLLLREW